MVLQGMPGETLTYSTVFLQMPGGNIGSTRVGDFNFDGFPDIACMIGEFRFYVMINTQKGVPTATSPQGSNDLPQLNIYPNPFDETIHVTGTNVNRLSLLDLGGREQLGTTGDQLTTKGLKAGIYILQIHMQNGRVETAKVVKQ